MKNPVIQQIGLSALLHDIGLHIPPSVTSEGTSTKSSDKEILKSEHPVRGAEILLASPRIPDLAPLVAYEHHIHYDGGGYPGKDRVQQLNLASMITCIANSYDNLRRDLPERRAVSFSEAVHWMDQRVETHFHPLLYKQFRELVIAQAQKDL